MKVETCPEYENILIDITSDLQHILDECPHKDSVHIMMSEFLIKPYPRVYVDAGHCVTGFIYRDRRIDDMLTKMIYQKLSLAIKMTNASYISDVKFHFTHKQNKATGDRVSIVIRRKFVEEYIIELDITTARDIITNNPTQK